MCSNFVVKSKTKGEKIYINLTTPLLTPPYLGASAICPEPKKDNKTMKEDESALLVFLFTVLVYGCGVCSFLSPGESFFHHSFCVCWFMFGLNSFSIFCPRLFLALTYENLTFHPSPAM